MIQGAWYDIDNPISCRTSHISWNWPDFLLTFPYKSFSSTVYILSNADITITIISKHCIVLSDKMEKWSYGWLVYGFNQCMVIIFFFLVTNSPCPIIKRRRKQKTEFQDPKRISAGNNHISHSWYSFQATKLQIGRVFYASSRGPDEFSFLKVYNFAGQ